MTIFTTHWFTTISEFSLSFPLCVQKTAKGFILVSWQISLHTLLKMKMTWFHWDLILTHLLIMLKPLSLCSDHYLELHMLTLHVCLNGSRNNSDAPSLLRPFRQQAMGYSTVKLKYVIQRLTCVSSSRFLGIRKDLATLLRPEWGIRHVNAAFPSVSYSWILGLML